MNISVSSERKVLVPLFTKKIVKMLSHVVNITVHSVSITCCKLSQQFGCQLLYWNSEGCASYVCHIHFKSTHLHITVCGILFEIDCFEIFKLLRILSISQYLAAPFSHCRAIIDNMVHNSSPFSSDMLLCTWPEASTASSSVLPLYPSTVHPYSSSSSQLLTLIVFWMFIHCQNL